MKTALLRLAPIYSGLDIADLESVRHMELFDRGALKPLPGQQAPVLASHDRDQEIGVVEELFVEQDPGGGT